MAVDLPAGIPGWRRTSCLGCGERVVANRHAHVIFYGTHDGSVLLAAGEPQRLFVSADLLPASAPFYILGAAHRRCILQARDGLEAGIVRLPDELPLAFIEPHNGQLERLALPPRPGCCPFCGSTDDITDEDIWARWISKLLRERFGKFRITTGSGYRERQRIDYLAPVCGSCNNRWLSVLEKDVIPVLSPMILGPQPGDPPCRTLTPDQQELLATWAVKTAFMIDCSRIARPVIPAYYYQQLRMYRRALPNTAVYTVGYNGCQRAIFAAHGGLHLNIEPALPSNAFMTVFSVCRVIFKVFGYLGPEFPVRIRYNSAFDAGLSQIWPPTGDSIEWPRNGMALNDDAVMRFAAEQPTLLSNVA